jgi:hypothetical protein
VFVLLPAENGRFEIGSERGEMQTTRRGSGKICVWGLQEDFLSLRILGWIFYSALWRSGVWEGNEICCVLGGVLAKRYQRNETFFSDTKTGREVFRVVGWKVEFEL